MATIKWSLFVEIYTFAPVRRLNKPNSTPKQKLQCYSKHIMWKNPECRPVYGKINSQWGDKVLYCALPEGIISSPEPANNPTAGYTDKTGKRGDITKAKKQRIKRAL